MVETRGYLRIAKYNDGADRTSSSNVIGKLQSFTGEHTGKYKPGTLKLSPVTINRTVGTCEASSVKLPIWVFTGWPPSGNGWVPSSVFLTGEVAAAHWQVVSAPPMPYLHNDVSLNRALAGLNKPALDVGLMIGELKETVHEFMHPLNSLYPLVMDFRKEALSRGRKKPKTPFSKILSSTWLEYVYGILPILNDIESTRQFFEKKREKTLGVLRRSSASTKKSSTLTLSSGFGSPYTDMTGSATATCERKVSTHIYYVGNDWNNNYAYLTDLGVNPFQILDVAYAITPYSFVVNWFMDFGTWLKAIQPHPHLDILGGCTTIKVSTRKDIRIDMGRSNLGSNPSYMPSPWVPINSKFEYEEATLTRILQTTWSAPPTIGNGIDSLSKTINTVAMLRQRIPLKW